MKVDPFSQSEVKAIFDQMVALMGTDYKSLTCTANHDGGGSNLSLSATETATGDTWNISHYVNGTRIVINPPGATLGPNASVDFVCTVVNSDGTSVGQPPVVWSLQPGAAGYIDASSGHYTSPMTITVASTDSVKCQLPDTNTWATAMVSLQPGTK